MQYFTFEEKKLITIQIQLTQKKNINWEPKNYFLQIINKFLYCQIDSRLYCWQNNPKDLELNYVIFVERNNQSILVLGYTLQQEKEKFENVQRYRFLCINV
ncbi:unnamed protein product [Paramecium sonneborni]|uniref:Uncharacterized protein n=1 Tax=Paramecium sonneborni TaxID=65129 RepID=A0A8S1NP25_9CILI|nr:unnamed protein product [Paramecium sonneborni]